MSSRLPARWLSALIAWGVVSGLAACGNENPKLMVTSIEPDKGADGTYVRIHGNRFIADGPRTVRVYFGDQEAQVDRFVSDSELIVVAPGGKVNEVVDVQVVFDTGARWKLEKAFRHVERNQSGPSVEDLNIAPKRGNK